MPKILINPFSIVQNRDLGLYFRPKIVLLGR